MKNLYSAHLESVLICFFMMGFTLTYAQEKQIDKAKPAPDSALKNYPLSSHKIFAIKSTTINSNKAAVVSPKSSHVQKIHSKQVPSSEVTAVRMTFRKVDDTVVSSKKTTRFKASDDSK